MGSIAGMSLVSFKSSCRAAARSFLETMVDSTPAAAVTQPPSSIRVAAQPLHEVRVRLHDVQLLPEALLEHVFGKQAG
jgi:hypothetical protein